jgi:dephospho-CoA kinase
MGSGKSTVAHLLRQMGFEVFDADQFARKALSPGSVGEAEVFRTFGGQLRGADGHLDRRALGRLVFGDKSKLEKLENIIHPLVRAETVAQRQRLATAGAKAAFYDVPLLFEKNMQGQFDLVLVVSAGKDLRARRLQARSQWTLEEIEERARHHIASEVKEAAASAVIRNDGSVEDLRANLVQVLSALKIPLP